MPFDCSNDFREEVVEAHAARRIRTYINDSVSNTSPKPSSKSECARAPEKNRRKPQLINHQTLKLAIRPHCDATRMTATPFSTAIFVPNGLDKVTRRSRICFATSGAGLLGIPNCEPGRGVSPVSIG